MANSKKTTIKTESKYLTYKDKPLVRCKDTIYYGDYKDDYVTKLEIKNTENQSNIKTATEISVKLLSTDPNIDAKKRLIKASKKHSLAEAIETAETWLNFAFNFSDDTKQ